MQKRCELFDIGDSAFTSAAGSEKIGHSAQTHICNRAGICIVACGGCERCVTEGGGDVLGGGSGVEGECRVESS